MYYPSPQSLRSQLLLEILNFLAPTLSNAYSSPCFTPAHEEEDEYTARSFRKVVSALRASTFIFFGLGSKKGTDL
jgi:hypothetical protein